MNKNWYFCKFQPRPMGLGPTLPSDFFLKMANYPVSSLIPSSNPPQNCSYFKSWPDSLCSFFNIWVFNALSEARAAMTPSSSSPWEISCILIFGLFWCEIMTCFWERDVITGDSQTIGDSPQFRVRFHLVTWVTTP